ncbi:MAG: asparagine synthase-related protein [bacterium]
MSGAWGLRGDLLGGEYPYLGADGRILGLDFGAAVRAAGTGPELDPAAVLAYLSCRFLVGDRTLLEGLRRAPWLAEPRPGGGWELLAPAREQPPAGDESALVAVWLRRLHQECRAAVEGMGTAGLLLSGGMDSRIAAGVLRRVELEAGGSLRIRALTWGRPGCRDVEYARRIATSFGWEWEHLPLGPADLERNITLAGRQGCEYAPLHLHALPEVGKRGDLDLVVAASYGDSVGRAEYSGVRLAGLRPVGAATLDPCGIMTAGALARGRAGLRADLQSFAARFAADGPGVRECEQMGHYMRRKLQAAMAACLAPTPLYQMFTTPGVYGLMWGLPASRRGDHHYRLLLDLLPGELREVPWARTGRPFGSAAGRADDLPAGHHLYGRWLREDLGALTAGRLLGDRILGCGIFHEPGLRRLVRIWRAGRGDGAGLLDETVSWLAGLDVMLDHLDAGPVVRRPEPLAHRVRCLGRSAWAAGYTAARNLLRS